MPYQAFKNIVKTLTNNYLYTPLTLPLSPQKENPQRKLWVFLCPKTSKTSFRKLLDIKKPKTHAVSLVLHACKGFPLWDREANPLNP